MLRTTGEKEFGKVRRPKMVSGLFGSNRSITDYAPCAREWRGTFMVSGTTLEEAESKRLDVICAITDECGVREYVDESPEVI